MTKDEAMKVKVGDTILWDNDPDQAGIVFAVDAKGFLVHWANGGHKKFWFQWASHAHIAQ